VSDRDHAEYFIWNETPFPFDDGETTARLMLDEAARLEAEAPRG
jgi:hypothetical protein